MRFCPGCEQEFEAAARRCPDCDVDLVESLDKPAGTGAEPPALAALGAADAAAAGRIQEVLRRLRVPFATSGTGDATDGGGGEGDGPPPRSGTGTAAAAQAPRAGVTFLVPPPVVGAVVGALEQDSELVRVVPPDGAAAADEAAPFFRSFDPQSDESHEIRVAPLLDQPVASLVARGPEVIESLLDLVLRGDATVGARAATVVGRFGARGREALLGLLPVLARREREPAVLAVLRELRDQDVAADAAAGLLELAADRDATASGRVLALHAVARLDLFAAWERVLPLLDDQEIEVREQADETLCVLADEDLGFDPQAPEAQRRDVMEAWRRHFSSMRG